MYEDVTTFLSESLSSEEVIVAVNFFDRGFSFNGLLALACVFVAAHGIGINPNGVIPLMESAWEKVWQFQDLKVRADPDANGPESKTNILAFRDIYQSLHVEIPRSGRVKSSANGSASG